MWFNIKCNIIGIRDKELTGTGFLITQHSRFTAVQNHNRLHSPKEKEILEIIGASRVPDGCWPMFLD